MRSGLGTRLFLRMLPWLVLAAAVPWAVQWAMAGAVRINWIAAAGATLLLLLLVAWSLQRALRPLQALFRALAGSVNSYRDGEYNFGVHWDSRDELGELVRAHGEMGDVLREQRQGLAQRELMLDTMVQNTPVAMLLIAHGPDGARRVLYGNLAARQLMHGGRKLEGRRFDTLLELLPTELREALNRSGDSLFTVAGSNGEDEQVYHLARREFRLNTRRHELLLIRVLTAELRRQEVQTWKKVIRVISHELNNSLAPIASLAHSGNELVRRAQYARLTEVFATIEERARHLESFIRGYAHFAKLPQPQLQFVAWAGFFARLQRQVAFQVEAPPPAPELMGYIDPAQMEQALLNLLKNSHDAGGGSDGAQAEVSVRLLTLAGFTRIEVRDRGPGMTETVLQNALIPFYSTKRNGTGLGLALTREIVEAHGGRLSLHNRDEGGLCVVVQLPLPPARGRVG